LSYSLTYYHYSIFSNRNLIFNFHHPCYYFAAINNSIYFKTYLFNLKHHLSSSVIQTSYHLNHLCHQKNFLIKILYFANNLFYFFHNFQCYKNQYLIIFENFPYFNNIGENYYFIYMIIHISLTSNIIIIIIYSCNLPDRSPRTSCHHYHFSMTISYLPNQLATFHLLKEKLFLNSEYFQMN
jgi:hypothetical protein